MNHITITNRSNPGAVAHSAATSALRASLLVLTVLALTTRVAATPVFFSVDPSSPIVVVHGRSPADIFDPVLVGPGPPPSGTCKTAADLGLAAGDNVDAVSIVSPHLLDAVGTVIGAKGNIVSNYYIWSVDRASVGRASGDFLCNLAGVVVPSVGSPVLNETVAGDSACGDVFMQVWTLLPPWPRVNLLWLEEVDNEETDGVFGGPGLDELDALAIVCGDEYFFSVDPVTAASLGVSPASILRVVPASGAWTEVLTPADLGLDPDDDIDALNVAVFDSSSNFILAFSLAPGSPSLIEPGTGFTWSPADIFLVSNSVPYPGMDTLCDIPDNRCWVPAEYLSLLPSDNLDALIVTMDDPCPKPLSEPTPTGQQFIRGDANQDYQVDMADAVFIMSYLSAGGPSPECMDAADADDSGTVDTSDVTFILNYTLGAAPPPPPFPDCGPDPTDDSLTCDKYDMCPGSSIPVAPQDAKWTQLPDVTNHGIDIRIDSSDGSVRTLADDFECRSRNLITD
ncbi:MAG: dockerin type I repeat-containing protein, partial [Planctomycetota bacterium]